jgi:hypothetical protein
VEEEEEEVVAVDSSLPFVSNLRFLFPDDDDGDLARCGDERGEEDGEEPSPSSPSAALCLRVEDMSIASDYVDGGAASR